MANFAILQSGFLTPYIEGLSKPMVAEPGITEIIMKPPRRTNKEFFYGEKMASLYNTYMQRDMIIRDFDFRHMVLEEFTRLLGKMSFKQWIYNQIYSTALTNTSLRFLTDTLNYIAGTDRSVDVINWIGLVEASQSTEHKKPSLEILQCYFGDRTDTSIYHGPILPPDLPSIIAAWTGRPSGWKDMMVSLGIIFGNHVVADIVKIQDNTPTNHTFYDALHAR